jgi:hypothetical protein
MTLMGKQRAILQSRSGRSERRAEGVSRTEHRQRAVQTAKRSIGNGLSGVLSADRRAEPNIVYGAAKCGRQRVECCHQQNSEPSRASSVEQAAELSVVSKPSSEQKRNVISEQSGESDECRQRAEWSIISKAAS